MPPVWRQIATSLINSPTQPLAELESITLAVPQHRANRLRRPAPDHETNLRILREQHVKTRWKFAALRWCLWLFECHNSNSASVTAPSEALVTWAAYFASTPRV